MSIRLHTEPAPQETLPDLPHLRGSHHPLQLRAYNFSYIYHNKVPTLCSVVLLECRLHENKENFFIPLYFLYPFKRAPFLNVGEQQMVELATKNKIIELSKLNLQCF